jgi:site-specific recombinase XerD
VREVGEAILLYLRKARPQTEQREVFLRLLPPFEPLTVSGLGTMVHFQLKSLNLKLPHYGPHALRHACASHLLAEGLSLKEIGDHLGRARRASTPKLIWKACAKSPVLTWEACYEPTTSR